MASCPKCGKEIDRLICMVPVYLEESVYVVEQDGGRDIFYEEICHHEIDHLENNYICLECDETLFHRGDEAANLLLGE